MFLRVFMVRQKRPISDVTHVKTRWEEAEESMRVLAQSRHSSQRGGAHKAIYQPEQTGR